MKLLFHLTAMRGMLYGVRMVMSDTHLGMFKHGPGGISHLCVSVITIPPRATFIGVHHE